MPDTGRLWIHRQPIHTQFPVVDNINCNSDSDSAEKRMWMPHVRVETGVKENGEVSVFYDPMIAKLIVKGNTREQAIKKLVMALDEYKVIYYCGFIFLLVSCVDCGTLYQYTVPQGCTASSDV